VVDVWLLKRLESLLNQVSWVRVGEPSSDLNELVSNAITDTVTDLVVPAILERLNDRPRERQERGRPQKHQYVRLEPVCSWMREDLRLPHRAIARMLSEWGVKTSSGGPIRENQVALILARRDKSAAS
jgi:hypothetical protein